jgi:hypothetical protein
VPSGSVLPWRALGSPPLPSAFWTGNRHGTPAPSPGNRPTPGARGAETEAGLAACPNLELPRGPRARGAQGREERSRLSYWGYPRRPLDARRSARSHGLMDLSADPAGWPPRPPPAPCGEGDGGRPFGSGVDPGVTTGCLIRLCSLFSQP